ncbi:MAG: DUF3791 domain-containing protein [Bacteroidales bacterium]|nr:DUF3791 domain-containing protein [Bacteroidales bacterium]
MSREDNNIVGYTVSLISEFATRFGIMHRQAYNYLKRFKGLEYYYTHYEVLHTQPFESAVDTLSQVCKNNGGQLI